MNLDELRAVRDEERASGELQALRPSFYAEAREFIAEIEDERDRQFEESDEPLNDPAVTRLNDKLNSATGVLESIFENRVSKLLTHALTVAAGDGADPPSMTAEEAELYAMVVKGIQATRTTAIEGTEATLPEPEVSAESDVSLDVSPEVASEVDESETTEEGMPDEDPAEAPADRRLVRINDDVGTILGVDEREYDLADGDVVSLPVENAQALIEREVAEPVEDG